MKLSISNIAWNTCDSECIYHYLKEKNFVGLEIAPTKVIAEKPYEHLDAIKNYQETLSREYGLEISSMQSIWYGITGNIFNSVDLIRLIEYTKKAILFAEKINCHNLVFGCPKNRNMPKGCKMSEADRFFDEVSSFAEEHNTTIALEANPVIYQTNFINTTKEAFEYVKSFNHKGLKVNVDLGTMIYNNEDLSCLMGNIPFINHIHISEPNLLKIERRELHRELRQFLSESHYSHYVSIEMKTLPQDDVKEVIDYISEVFM